MVNLILLMLLVVGLGSGSSGYCCPICGLKLVPVEYKGKEPDKLALMGRDGFCGFLGCVRVDLHDKVVDGVNYRGKVYVVPIFHSRNVRRRKRVS
jgi:hypothetical protein